VAGTQRDRQREATRDALRSVGLRMFAENGFQETTVDQIAAAVGVTRRTFFLHYASKDDLLLGHVPAQLARLRAELDAAPPELEVVARAGHALAGLAAAMQARDDLMLQLDLLYRAPQLHAVNLEQFTAFEDAVGDAVRRWLAGRRRLRREEDAFARLVGMVGIAALRAALRAWHRRGGRGSLPALVHRQVDLIRGGLQAP
jgi:AcrR family transcriptional regulator